MCGSSPSVQKATPPPPPPPTPAAPTAMVTPDELTRNSVGGDGSRSAANARGKLRIDLNTNSQGSGLRIPT